jgi:hypothetical protein
MEKLRMSSPSSKKQQADAAARAEITKRLFALEHSLKSGSDFIDGDGRRVTRVRFDLNELKAAGRLRAQLEALDSKSPRRRGARGPARTSPITDNTFLTEAMLAARWHCSRSRLQHWRLDSKGPRFVKIGGRVLYALEDVSAFEEAQRTSR